MPDATERPRLDAPRAVAACAPLLGLAAFALLEWADWGATRDPGARGGGAELDVWQFLVTASVVVWAVLAATGLRLLSDLPARGGRQTALFVSWVYVVIAAVLVAGGIRNPYVMDGQDWKIPLLHVVAGIATLPLLVALKRVQLAAADDDGWSTTARDVARLRSLRRASSTATAALGAVIALAVIATGALREATLAAKLEPAPETFVLVYGAWFTGVVAAVYLHVFGALEARGRRMLEAAAPLPDVTPESLAAFAARRGERAEIAAELELGGDARRNLEGLVAVLAPLAGALLTRLGGL